MSEMFDFPDFDGLGTMAALGAKVPSEVLAEPLP
jgi:hypothetical protein